MFKVFILFILSYIALDNDDIEESNKAKADEGVDYCCINQLYLQSWQGRTRQEISIMDNAFIFGVGIGVKQRLLQILGS